MDSEKYHTRTQMNFVVGLSNVSCLLLMCVNYVACLHPV